MSCSKFASQTPFTEIHASEFAMLDAIPKIKTRLGHGYTRTTEAFSIMSAAGDWTYWLLQIFDTPNKKNESKTANAYLWRVITHNKIESFTQTPEPYSMDDGRVLSLILCPVAKEEMFGLPKSLAACLYTTNSLAALSSFSLTHNVKNPSCLEFYFNVIAKSRFALTHLVSMKDKDVFDLLTTTRFMDADTLLDILSDLDNETRFKRRAPADLSDDDRKKFNEDALQSTRQHIKDTGKHKELKALVMRWLERNLELAHTTDPELCKLRIGRMIPIPEEKIADWNRSAGLLMIVIASKLYKDSPVDLQNALPAGYGAWVAEFTPKDERYGVTVDQMDLDKACKTARGKIGLMKLLDKEHERQEAFITDFKAILEAPGNDELAKAQAALEKLTHGIDQYATSIHGLARSILLRIITGEIKISCMLYAEILGFCRKLGLNWSLEHTTVYQNDEDDSFDPYVLLHLSGESTHPMREDRVSGVKRASSD